MANSVWLVKAETDDAAYNAAFDGPVVGVAKTERAARHLAETHARVYLLSLDKDEAARTLVTIDGETFHGDEDDNDFEFVLSFEELALQEDEGEHEDASPRR